MRGDDIAERALRVGDLGIEVADGLPHTPAGRHVASQLVRCATGVGSNYEEARGAESRRDFVHKLAVSHKEAQETLYWAKLVERRRMFPGTTIIQLRTEALSMCKILATSIATCRRNSPHILSDS